MTKLLLKNKLTTAVLALLFLTLVPLQMMAQKRVLFICRSDFTPGAGASASDADPFITLLQADTANFTVTTITTTDGTTSVKKNGVADVTALLVGGVPANTSPANIATFYSNYDLVVTQESFSSGNAIWKPAGLLGIKNITIPAIYTKLFALRSSNATTNLALTDWSTNTTDNTLNIPATIPAGNKLAVTVDPANQTNPLFTGIDFSGGNDITIFNALATDAGIAGTKAIDMAANENITTIASGALANQLNTLLAYITYPTAPAALNPNSTVCINDIPGGTYFGTAGDMLPTTSHMITFGYNYGATVLGSGSNITAAGLTIFKNAALILTQLPLGVKESTLASGSVSVSPNPTSGIVTVNSASEVKAITVFDCNGRQVLSANNTTTVDLSSQAKGVYMVQVQTENGSTTKKVVVE